MIGYMSDSIGKELRAWRKSHGFTQNDIAEKLDVTHQYISMMEKEIQAIPSEKMKTLEEMGFRQGNMEPDNAPRSLLGLRLKPIEIIGNASAGEGATNTDQDNPPIYVPDSLAVPGNTGFVIEGDSMMPHLQPGDVAIFKPVSTPRVGFTYLIKTANAEFRVKNLIWKGGHWMMSSLNSIYEDEFLSDGQIIGFLVGYYRAHGDYEALESQPHGLKLEKFL